MKKLTIRKIRFPEEVTAARVGPHPVKESRRKRYPDDCQKQPADKPERHHRMNGAGYLFSVFCPEIPGNNNAAAHRESHEKADHQKNQISRRSYRRQRIRSKISAHNKGVRRIVHLLKNLTQQKRHRKLKHQGIGIPLRHIQYTRRLFLSRFFPD